MRRCDLQRIREATAFICTDTLRHLSNFQNFAKGFFFKIGNKLKQPLAFREWLHIKSLPTLQDKRFCCGCFLLRFIVNVLLDFLSSNLLKEELSGTPIVRSQR